MDERTVGVSEADGTESWTRSSDYDICGSALGCHPPCQWHEAVQRCAWLDNVGEGQTPGYVTDKDSTNIIHYISKNYSMGTVTRDCIYTMLWRHIVS